MTRRKFLGPCCSFCGLAFFAHFGHGDFWIQLPREGLPGTLLFFHGCVSRNPQDTTCGKQQSAATHEDP